MKKLYLILIATVLAISQASAVDELTQKQQERVKAAMAQLTPEQQEKVQQMAQQIESAMQKGSVARGETEATKKQYLAKLENAIKNGLPLRNLMSRDMPFNVNTYTDLEPLLEKYHTVIVKRARAALQNKEASPEEVGGITSTLGLLLMPSGCFDEATLYNALFKKLMEQAKLMKQAKKK